MFRNAETDPDGKAPREQKEIPDGKESGDGNKTQRRNPRGVGSYYEHLAETYLSRKYGYRVVAKNFRCKCGEIDLVALDGKIWVFIEVKYRRDERAGHGFEAVNASKQRRICRASDYFRLRRRLPPDAGCRYDVVAITGDHIRLLKNAFPYHP